MHNNWYRTKNEEPWPLTHGGRTYEDDPWGKVVLTESRETTIPACCDEKVQAAEIITVSSSAPSLGCSENVSPLEVQVEGSAVVNNSKCLIVKAGERVENWSSG